MTPSHIINLDQYPQAMRCLDTMDTLLRLACLQHSQNRSRLILTREVQSRNTHTLKMQDGRTRNTRHRLHKKTHTTVILDRIHFPLYPCMNVRNNTNTRPHRRHQGRIPCCHLRQILSTIITTRTTRIDNLFRTPKRNHHSSFPHGTDLVSIVPFMTKDYRRLAMVGDPEEQLRQIAWHVNGAGISPRRQPRY
jgi:hypothetical protein